MSKRVITDEIARQVESLYGELSRTRISRQLGISESSVQRIIKAYNIKRSRDDEHKVRSRMRRDLIGSERRRAIFGLEQRTNVKVFTNRERNTLKYCLRRKKYIFLKRGDTTAYFNENTQRHPDYEERGRKLGLRFKPLEEKCS